jgi:hypothetical protein
MKVIIAGSRDFSDYEQMCEVSDNFLFGKTDIEIVSGGANGADNLGERYANERGYHITIMNPDWSLGRGAGIERNKKMAEYADASIIFWNGESRGTKNMIKLSKKHLLKLHVHNY